MTSVTLPGICSRTQAMLRASFRAGITRLTVGVGNAVGSRTNDDSGREWLLVSSEMVDWVLLKTSWEPLGDSTNDISITSRIVAESKTLWRRGSHRRRRPPAHAPANHWVIGHAIVVGQQCAMVGHRENCAESHTVRTN